MKRAVTFILTAILATMIFCTGCGKDDYSGNYKEATTNDVKTLLSKIDEDAFYDKGAGELSFGVDGTVNCEIEVKSKDWSIKLDTENAIKFRAKTNSEFEKGYFTCAFDTNTEYEVSGDVSKNMNKNRYYYDYYDYYRYGGYPYYAYNGMWTSFAQNSFTMEGSGVIDKKGTVYLDGKFAMGKKLNVEGKLAFDTGIANRNDDIAGELLNELNEIATSLKNVEIGEVLEQAKELGIEVYFDSSNGYKIKVVVPQKAQGTIKEALELSSADTLEIDECYAYIVFDDFGKFVCAKLVIDANVEMSETETTLSIDGQIELKRNTSDDVTTPSNTDEYAIVNI